METVWDLILLPQGDSISCAGCPARLALYLRRSVPPLAADMTRAVPLGCLARVVPCAE